MTNYFNSGLFTATFYTKHNMEFFFDTSHGAENVKYEHGLLAEYYKNNFGLEYKNEDDEDEQVDQIFWDALSYRPTYFEPLVFNAEIALECGLTPFRYDKIYLLAASGREMYLPAKLDAYQVLTHGSIDPYTPLFSDSDYFEYVVGKETTAKVLKAIS